MIINEAYFTAAEGHRFAEDIDISMKLDTNYPFGPFEWSKKIEPPQRIRSTAGSLSSHRQ